MAIPLPAPFTRFATTLPYVIVRRELYRQRGSKTGVGIGGDSRILGPGMLDIRG